MAYNSCCGGNSQDFSNSNIYSDFYTSHSYSQMLSFPTDISNLILHRYTLDIPYPVSQTALLTITHKKSSYRHWTISEVKVTSHSWQGSNAHSCLFIVPYLFNSNKLEIYFTCPISAFALNSYYDVDAFLSFSFPKSFSFS